MNEQQKARNWETPQLHVIRYHSLTQNLMLISCPAYKSDNWLSCVQSICTSDARHVVLFF